MFTMPLAPATPSPAVADNAAGTEPIGALAERSAAQVEASRSNGALSRGPVSADGKARSATNALQHGLSGGLFRLLPDEDPAEFEASWCEWRAALEPVGDLEERVILRIAQVRWRQGRCDRLLDDMLARLRSVESGTKEGGDDLQASRLLSTLMRYKVRLEHDLWAAEKDLTRLRELRAAAAEPPLEPPMKPEAEAPPPEPAFDRRALLAQMMQRCAAASGSFGSLTAERPVAPAPAREPEPQTGVVAETKPLSRAQRRRLAALARQNAKKAA